MIDRQRLQEIGRIISEAMRSAEGTDWTKDSPEIAAAQAEMDEAMALYAEGNASKAEVRTAYRKWKDLHKTGASA